MRLNVARRVKAISDAYPHHISKSIHGFVQRIDISTVNVFLVMQEPLTKAHLEPIYQYMISLNVGREQFHQESSRTDALALESLNEKFKIVRNKPEQDGFSFYAEEDFINDDAFSMVSSIHR